MGSDQILILCVLFKVLDQEIDKVANSCSAIHNYSFLLEVGVNFATCPIVIPNFSWIFLQYGESISFVTFLFSAAKG